MTDPDDLTQTRDAYDAVAEDYAALLPALSAETALDIAMLADFAERCLESPLGPVADLGCGTGRISAHLAARGVDVFGVDLSAGMVDVARRNHPEITFDVGPMEALPIRDDTLGGALVWYSMIHTRPEMLGALVDEFARVMRSGAWLLTSFQAGEGERSERAGSYGHPVSMTNYRHAPQHVVDVLDASGFDLHARLQRAPEGSETTPQVVLLGRRRPR
ncbi:MAG: class SAM-dependent methyltransferase [Nocardioides sp.]|uniref:class I SAM-dependent DNA methyltransferase n=1 Tax=Nocardioides sp. TaxID=35761 RepID=UPI002626EF7C|nr:class I SAM-dependent methyltransferase [Nocardioides sp.]MCW2832280.1 class SAM-dependent methyltransferase [Nocardioides sp.]